MYGAHWTRRTLWRTLGLDITIWGTTFITHSLGRMKHGAPWHICGCLTSANTLPPPKKKNAERG